MKKLVLIIGGMFMIAAAIVYINTGTVFGMTIGNITKNKPTGDTEYFQFFQNATTTTATSTNNNVGDGAFKIAGAKNVHLFFSRGGVNGPNTGSTLFKIQVSPDCTANNWFDYNTLTLNQATTSYPNANASFLIGASTSTLVAKMRDLGFCSIRAIVLETTDGEHQVKAVAEF